MINSTQLCPVMHPHRTRRRVPALTLLILLVIVMLMPGLTACTAAVGVGATVGVAASQERGLGQAVSDSIIYTTIVSKWLNADPKLVRDLSAKVVEGEVLLTGTLSSETDLIEAVHIVWNVDGVTRVINEITLTDRNSLVDFATDSVVSSKLYTRLTLDPDIYSVNYTFETTQGVIYLFGIARDTDEMKKVVAHAKDIDSVKRVVNHIRVRRGTSTSP